MKSGTYIDALTVWILKRELIQDFDQEHPRGECSIGRQGDHLYCRTCKVSSYAPPAGPRPKDAMEASLSRFD